MVKLLAVSILLIFVAAFGCWPAPSQATGQLSASPNPVKVCNGSSGSATLFWTPAIAGQYEIWRGDDHSTLIATATGSGSQVVSGISSATNFYLLKAATNETWSFNPQDGLTKVVTTTWLTLDRITVSTVEDCSDPRPPNHPLVGAIRWDAWKPNNQNFGVSPSFYTNWAHRQPFYGWYNVDVPVGAVPNHQAIIDQEINYAADNFLDYWNFVWYPEYGNPQPQYEVYSLMKPFRDYMASPYKSRIKFCFMLQTTWVAGDQPNDPNGREIRWRSDVVPGLVALFQDVQYLKVNGNRPVIYWFDTGKLGSQPDGFGANWQAELQFLKDAIATAGLGQPFFVDNNMDLGSAQAAGFQAVTSYGPSGAMPSGFCWSAQAAKDQGNWGPHQTLLTVPSLTPVHDPRPRNYGYFVQPPTYGQWETHLQNAFNWITNNPTKVSSPPLLLTYAWNELDEGGGGITPTLQDGIKYLKAIKAVAAGQLPLTYEDVYNADNCAITFQGGSWLRWTPASNNHEGDDQISFAAGESASLTANGVTKFTVMAIRGPNRGQFEIYIDDVLQGVINQNDPNWLPAAPLYQSAQLPVGAHTLRFVNRAANPSQSQVSFDSIKVQRQR